MLCRIERRPPRLDLTGYPYLPRASVAMTSAKAYLDLLTGASPVNFSIYPCPSRADANTEWVRAGRVPGTW